MGYPAYQGQEVFDAVATFLKRAGKPSDHASVSNWIRANDTQSGRQAIFGIMTEQVMHLAGTPSRTPTQQKLLDTVAAAVQSNRIAAYKEVEAEYQAWQDDVRRAKEGKMPTLYNLIDLGEKPPQALLHKLGLARNGMTDAELKATGAVIGASVAYASTAAGLTAMALAGSGKGVVGALMPFATSAATSMAASGPAALFVAVVASDAVVKVAQIEKFKDDMEKLKAHAYAAPSVESILGAGKMGNAEILNALRELNGFGG